MSDTYDCPSCDGPMRPARLSWVRACGCGVLRSTLDIAIPAKPRASAIDEQARVDGLASLRDRNNGRLLDTIYGLTAGRRLLDVGCGPGFLLAQAGAFQAVGIEPDANVALAATTSAKVRHGYFPDALAPDERFDVIVFNDVLEHIPDMRQALAASHRHLSDDGVLVLNCPSRNGLFFRVASILERLGMRAAYERLWQVGLPSPHIWYMTPRDLTRAAEKANLAEVRQVRLDTTDTRGLWSRIRSVRDEGLLLSVAAYGFTRIAHPFAKMLPSDAVAVFYRKQLAA